MQHDEEEDDDEGGFAPAVSNGVKGILQNGSSHSPATASAAVCSPTSPMGK